MRLEDIIGRVEAVMHTPPGDPVEQTDIIRVKNDARDLANRIHELASRPANGGARWELNKALDCANDTVTALIAAYEELR